MEGLENEDRTGTVHILCYSILSFSCKHKVLLGPWARRLHTVNGVG